MLSFFRFLAIFLSLATSAQAEGLSSQSLLRTLPVEISQRISRVAEFQFIREEAAKRGLKVYLFGGTAASYAHYVREDLLREAGDPRYPGSRFDYDYTSIFRSTQDLDVVVDGSAEQASALESLLKEKFPHFVGDKSAKWEVRPLRVPLRDKEAILGNASFANQNTDSHSTGLIEITEPSGGGSAVKDARDWDAKTPQFLRDVAEAKIHYYRSPLHFKTERAAQGLNPEILSVIRFLTKAFQYDLEIRPDDLKEIRKVVDAFKPSDIDNDYLSNWVEKNGKKLLQHSVDLERSGKILDDLGLRKKLIAVLNNPGVEGSLAWWLSREPLAAKPVGQGRGKTAAALAAELKLEKITLAHETKSFLAFESLTRDKAGNLNAFLSRGGEKRAGEKAMFGDGFYTVLGEKSTVGTGLTVRMDLDPLAREGSDFFYLPDQNVFVVTNRAAVRVRHEKINLSLLEYFRKLSVAEDFGEDNQALLEIFRRKTSRAFLLPAKEKKELLGLIAEAIDHSEEPRYQKLLTEWFSHPLSRELPAFRQKMIPRLAKAIPRLQSLVLADPQLPGYQKLVAELLQAGAEGRYAILRSRPARQVMGDKLSLSRLDHYQLLAGDEWEAASTKQALLRKTAALPSPSAKDEAEIVKLITQTVEHAERPSSWPILKAWLEDPLSKKHPQILSQMLGHLDEMSPELSTKLLSREDIPDLRSEVEKILRSHRGERSVIRKVLPRPEWVNRPDLIEELLARGGFEREIANSILSQPHWSGHPEWLEKVLARPNSVDLAIQSALSQPHWKHRADLVELYLRKNKQKHAKAIITYVLSQPHWADRPDLLKPLLADGKFDQQIAQYVLSQPHWAGHPELLETLVRNGRLADLTLENLLREPHWRDHPALRKAVGGAVNLKSFRTALENGFTFADPPSLPAGKMRLLHWQPEGHHFPFVIPQRENESPAAALERYLKALEKEPKLRPFAEPLRRIKQGVFMPYALEETPAMLVVTNAVKDLTPRSSRMHRIFDPLKARGVNGVMLPVAAGAGLGKAEKAEFFALVRKNFPGLFALGGEDLDASLLGKRDPKKLTEKPNLPRDAEELPLVKDYILEGDGFFSAVCRGHQVGAVANGCDLTLDIKEEFGVEHARPVDPDVMVYHDIKRHAGSGPLTEKFFGGEEEMRVMSNHHQSVLDPENANPRLKVTGVVAGEDRIVEVIEYANGRGFSTQTHPELMPGTELHGRFFDLLAEEVKAAHARMGRVAAAIPPPRGGCAGKFKAIAAGTRGR